MATEVETPVATNVVSTADHLKAVFVNMSEQSVQLKALMLTVKNLIKDVEKQSKEFDKLRNKKSRNRSERKASDTPSRITKPVAISDELARFLGVEPGTLVPRNEVTKGVSGFVKSNGLSDPLNKQKFILDERPAAKSLRVLLGNPKEDVTYFNLQRYLKHHYIGCTTTTDKPATKKAAEPAAVPPPVAEPVVVKKKILVKKRPASSELAEEA
jgi:chromatin remodeling complex protein RSC6